MDEASFIFYENNYAWSSFSAFQDMRITAELTDLTIRTRDRQFSVHRLILAARIPHFRKILTSQDREISLNDVDSDVLDSLINFAYEGKLKVTLENLQPMFFAAVCLDLRKVQEACLEFHRKRFNLNNAVNTINLIPSDLEIRNNFDEFCSSQEFLLLPYYSLKELIGRDDIKVTNEEKVFEALIRWITESPTERQHHLPYLLPEIRMNYLSPEYLIERVAAEMLIVTSDRARRIVEDAKSYHLLKKRPMLLSFNSNARLYADTHTTVPCGGKIIIPATQNDLMPSDAMRAPSSNNPTSSQSDLGISDTVNFSVSNIHSTDQSDFMFDESSNILASNVPDTNQKDLASNDLSNVRPDSMLATNQSHMTSNDVSDTTLNSVPVISQSDLVPDSTNNVSAINTLATNKHEVTLSDACSFSSIAETSHNNLRSGTSSLPTNERCSSDRSDCNSIKHGIYAVRSFSSTDTVVSYYNHRNRKWNDFPFISHCGLVLHVVLADVKLYVFFPKSVQTFHLVTHKWDTVEQLFISTEGSGVVSQGRKIYIYGGVHNLNRVQCFDTEENKWLQNQAMRMPCHSMSVLSSPKKFVLLTGGCNTSCLNTFYAINNYTEQWTPMPPMITRRMKHASAVACGKFYVCGGLNDSIEFLDTVEVYDTNSQCWNSVSHLNISRTSHSLISWRRKMYIFGGKTENEDCSCLVEVYDPSTDNWVSTSLERPLDTSDVISTAGHFTTDEILPSNLKAILVASVE